MIPLRLWVRFGADEDYGRSLGRLRDLLKTQAKLAGLEIRKRPHGVGAGGWLIGICFGLSHVLAMNSWLYKLDQIPATGDFSDARVIRKFGDVPDDLSAL